MTIEKIEQLLEKYLKGDTTLQEEQKLRDFFRDDEVPDHLKSYADLVLYFDNVGKEKSSLDPFAKIDRDSESNMSPLEEIFGRMADKHSVTMWSMRIAAGIIFILIGFSAGLLISSPNGGASDEELAALQSEIQLIKGALMYGQYQKASASERISAVNMSSRISDSDELNDQITEILIYTMNNDKNVNVRLAAMDALFKFRSEPHIRKALVNSLTKQDDPMAQITLIDLLVKIKEKAAINEMQKLLLDSDTRQVVRERLQQGIAELKT